MALKIMKKISPEYVLTQASKDVKIRARRIEALPD